MNDIILLSAVSCFLVWLLESGLHLQLNSETYNNKGVQAKNLSLNVNIMGYIMD